MAQERSTAETGDPSPPLSLMGSVIIDLNGKQKNKSAGQDDEDDE